MSKIIIDINDGNKAKKFEDDGLLQIKAYRRVTEVLNKHSYNDERTENIVDCRFHDTIFIDGDRGVGKTAFMLNIEKYYNNIALNEQKTMDRKYLFLDPVDPTLLEHTEKFLSVILARIVERVNSDIEFNNINTSELDTYYKKLEKLSISLTAIKTLPDDLGIDEIASNKSSLRLEQNAHEFFKEVSTKLYNVDALVMLIDDIDMAFDKGFDVLEVVRKYLASPYLIPIVAGDMKLYKEIIETQFMKKLGLNDDIKHLRNIYDNLNNSDEYNDKKKLLDNLVEQYLHKVFPSEYHIKLKDIFSILKNNSVLIRLKNNIEVDYQDLKDFEIRLINYGINQKKFTYLVFPNNTRNFIQYIYNKQDIFYEVFKNKDDLPKKDINKDNFLVSNRFDSLINKKILSDIGLHRKSIELTSDFYRYSNDKDKKRLSALLDNDVNSFTEKGYSIYKALKGDFLSKNNSLNELQREVVRNKLDFTSHKDYVELLRDLKSNYPQDFFIFQSLLHNDYYSNTDTKYMFITGKLLETFFCLIDKNKTDKFNLIKNVTEPLFSEMEESNYLEFNELSEDSTDNNIFLVEKEIFSIFEKKVEKFEGVPFISSIFLYEFLKKYFKNLNIYKVGNKYTSNKDEYNKIYREIPFFDNMLRVLYMIQNSMAYFELRDKPSNENIAVSKKNVMFDISRSKTYNINVKSIIEEGRNRTLTELFEYLFSDILHEKNKDNLIFKSSLNEISGDVKKYENQIKVDNILLSAGLKGRMKEEDKFKLITNLINKVPELDKEVNKLILEYHRFKENIIYYSRYENPIIKDRALELKDLLEKYSR